jgi:HAD superfamily, subfamily IIIB (Acid phosphatase)
MCAEDMHKLASVYKPERRKTFVDAGYKIVGTFGDQYSDLEGAYPAVASWKLPNPMYYIL